MLDASGENAKFVVRKSILQARDLLVGTTERIIVLNMGVRSLLGCSWSWLKRKIRKVLDGSLACMNGREIDASSRAVACLPCDVVSLEAWVCAGSLDDAGAVWRAKIRNVQTKFCAGMYAKGNPSSG